MKIKILMLYRIYYIKVRIIINTWNERANQIALFVGPCVCACARMPPLHTVRECQLQKLHHKY